MKQIVKTLLLIIALLFFSINLYDYNHMNSTQSVSASSKKPTKKAALKAYKIFLKNPGEGMGINSDNIKDVKFAVKDMNKDGIPELLLDTSSSSVLGLRDANTLYTYYDAQVVRVDSTSYNYFGYLKKGNVYTSGYMDKGYDNTYYNTIVKGELKTVASIIDSSATMDADNAGIEYYIGEKKTSKKKFNKYIKKITKGSKEEKCKKFYSVTDSNIKKFLK